MEPEKIKSFFIGSQYLLGGLLLLVIYFFSRPKKDSLFRTRETDAEKTNPKAKDHQKKPGLADARYKPKVEPLRLNGVVLTAEPHELLKIKENAVEPEIQKAFRDLMKQYHPDKVGRPGSREWKDAQEIAEALNRARNQMVEKRKSGR